MNIAQATGILKPKNDSMEGLKVAYHVACKIYHPDVNPHGLEMMKLINCAYGFLQQHLGKWHPSDATAGPGLDEILQGTFDKIKHYCNVEAEICEVKDTDTLGECMTLVDNKGKIEAVDGKNDDCIIATAIAIQMMKRSGAGFTSNILNW